MYTVLGRHRRKRDVEGRRTLGDQDPIGHCRITGERDIKDVGGKRRRPDCEGGERWQKRTLPHIRG